MKIVAKFMLTEMNLFSNGNWDGSIFKFTPMYDPSLPEDRRFSMATPSGEFKMTVDNPPVQEFLKHYLGKQFKIYMVPEEDDSEQS